MIINTYHNVNYHTGSKIRIMSNNIGSLGQLITIVAARLTKACLAKL